METNEMKVILYTTHCPRCVVLQKKLEAKNIQFETVTDLAIMQEKGFMAAPMLEVNGEVMDFGKANEWINKL